jgi:hypothetical protein
LKTWRYQYRFGGIRRDLKIGRYPEIGVADARDRHFELRSLLERGVDPFDARRQELADRKMRMAEAKSAGDEFEAFSKRWVRERLLTKSATYRKQIESRLERFVWPAIGAKSLNAVRPADVLELIEARRETPKTAEGVRAGRCRRQGGHASPRAADDGFAAAGCRRRRAMRRALAKRD